MSNTAERFEALTGIAYATRTCLKCGMIWNHASDVCPRCGPETRTIKERTVPADILRLAQDSPLVAVCVACWREGAVTWEEAMMAACRMLAEQNARLQQEASKSHEVQLPTAVEVEGGIHEYTGPCFLCGQPVKPEVRHAWEGKKNA
jgi:RNA polymerase subunit RPABC4/transcription elongation factor Spt4